MLRHIASAPGATDQSVLKVRAAKQIAIYSDLQNSMRRGTL